jgi:hypothetical protein
MQIDPYDRVRIIMLNHNEGRTISQVDLRILATSWQETNKGKINLIVQ